MKIIKRSSANPVSSISIFFIPIMSYVIQKVAGVIRPDREWIWWVSLPLVFALWVVINFKIAKNK